jgi:hypothetical protein
MYKHYKQQKVFNLVTFKLQRLNKNSSTYLQKCKLYTTVLNNIVNNTQLYNVNMF